MKKTINYEKDIELKAPAHEVCSISLEHDFTIEENCLKGDFIISGEYKTNELSLNKEVFSYRLPLYFELDPNVDIETLTYDVDNFEYTIDNKVLSIYIDFGINYEEKRIEPIIPDSYALNELLEMDAFKPEREEEIELPRLKAKDEEVITELTINEEDEYMIYHVHIVREGDTFESIANKYGVTVSDIKEYNPNCTLELKEKLIIPAL